VFDSVETKITK